MSCKKRLKRLKAEHNNLIQQLSDTYLMLRYNYISDTDKAIILNILNCLQRKKGKFQDDIEYVEISNELELSKDVVENILAHLYI